jgi:hypothetical protein
LSKPAVHCTCVRSCSPYRSHTAGKTIQENKFEILHGRQVQVQVQVQAEVEVHVEVQVQVEVQVEVQVQVQVPVEGMY